MIDKYGQVMSKDSTGKKIPTVSPKGFKREIRAWVSGKIPCSLTWFDFFNDPFFLSWQGKLINKIWKPLEYLYDEFGIKPCAALFILSKCAWGDEWIRSRTTPYDCFMGQLERLSKALNSCNDRRSVKFIFSQFMRNTDVKRARWPHNKWTNHMKNQCTGFLMSLIEHSSVGHKREAALEIAAELTEIAFGGRRVKSAGAWDKMTDLGKKRIKRHGLPMPNDHDVLHEALSLELMGTGAYLKDFPVSAS